MRRVRPRPGPAPLLGLALVLAGVGSAVGAAAAAGQGGAVAAPEDRAALQARLMADLRALAHDSMQGRAPGTPGAEMARRHIRQRLVALGLRVAEDTFPVPGGEGAIVDGVNLRVRFPGTRHPGRVVVAMAHYDHVGVRGGQIFNGADDNASGTAGLLELARGLAANPPQHTVLLLFLDAEEGGLRGARHWVSRPSEPLERLVVAVNLDMISHSDSVLWVAGTYPWPQLRPVVQAVDPAPPVRLRLGHDRPEDRGGDNWVGASDHAPFHRAGIPFLYFGVADHEDYHRPSDDPERVNPVFFTGAVETVGRVLRQLDGTLEGARPGGGR